MPKINSVLIANRGEIALRVIRTCKEMGITTIAVYSDVDRESPHLLAADRSYPLDGVSSAETYLSIEKIVDIAEHAEADAIHPGYGFLSENAQFADACKQRGIQFIGPKPESIALMGDKTAARERMEQAGVPTPPGTRDALDSIGEAKKAAGEIGFPILIKAAAGGGGKGMRVVESPERFETEVKAARSEAKNAFGDDRVYIEKYLESPKHIEFQILADTHGNVLHLFERECSVQRRHQKVVEESPCSSLTADLRKEMADAAVAAARACDYIGAGTVEFLLDRHHNFYFLEMNTRLQVEHPVTELITGVDLVEMQVRIARGEELPFTQEELSMNGHAIECRIYAEDPSNRFLPSTGLLNRHRPAAGPGVRVDSGVEEGQNITIHYDPMISKLCVHGGSREAAIRRMIRALDEYEISGCRTTIPFCRYVMKHPQFVDGKYDTGFISDYFEGTDLYETTFQDQDVDSLAAALLTLEKNENQGDGAAGASGRKLNRSDQRIGARKNGFGNESNSTWWRTRRYN